MPFFTVTMGVLQTRAYQVHADTHEEAEREAKSDMDLLEYDIVSEEVDTIDSEENDV